MLKPDRSVSIGLCVNFKKEQNSGGILNIS